MAGIKIPVEAQFDKGNIEQTLQSFQQQINRLGQTVAQANKVKFSPIDKASVEDIKRVTAAFENLRKVHGDLNKRMQSTGQGNSGFLDLDWKKLYPNASSRHRQMQSAFQYVTGAEFSGGGGGGGHSGQSGGHWHAAGRHAVGAGLNAAGGGGRAVNGAISSGMSGGFGAFAASLAGNFAAMALQKAIGAVMDKIGDAQTESIGYDTLKRTLGDVNISFNVLKASLRASARSLDMTFDESQRLGTQFAKLAGMSKQTYSTIGEEVNVGGGFGRSFGMDPSQSNSFFAQMRLFQVTRTTQESRELGLMVGESIAKSGTFSKADEVLEAIAGFTATQTRLGLNSANVGGYAELLTGLMGSGRAGLDPMGAARLLGQVNSSIAGGGAAGEAGQNFLYSAIGGPLGLNPIQAAILREQGAFGTGKGTFGSGSMYGDFAKKYGLGTPGGAMSDTTNLQMIMEKLQQVYAGNPELMVNAMSNLFGVNNSQAMALSTIDPTQLGGLSARLKKNGVNINDINATGISRISQIEADGSLSDDEKNRLIKEASTQNQEETEGSKTRATINGVERATVNAASQLLVPLNHIRSGIMYMAGEGGKKSPREIMEAVMSAESRDREGQIRRKFDAEMSAEAGNVSGLASKRSGLLSNLSKNYNSMSVEERARAQAEITQLSDQLAKQDVETKKRVLKLMDEKEKALQDEVDALRESVEALRNPTPGVDGDNITVGSTGRRRFGGGGRTYGTLSGSTSFDADAASEGLTDVERRLALAIYEQESGSGSNTATSINGAVGGMQMLPDTFNAHADKGWDINNPEHNRRAGMRYIKHLLKVSGGNVRSAAGGYYGGEGAIRGDGSLRTFYNKKRLTDPSTQEYADSVVDNMGRIPESNTPLPAVARPSDVYGQTHKVDINGVFTLNNPNGTQAAAPVNINTRVGAPTPAGINR